MPKYTVKKWCIDCGAVVSSMRAIRCMSCYVRHRYPNPMTGAEKAAKWRAAHPERNIEVRTRQRLSKRAYVDSVKSEAGCQRCHISDTRVLDLHHTDPREKDMAVSRLIARKGWEALKAEVEKCIVLCANCHRITHYEQRIE